MVRREGIQLIAAGDIPDVDGAIAAADRDNAAAVRHQGRRPDGVRLPAEDCRTLPVAASHKRTAPSEPAVTSIRSSGDQFADQNLSPVEVPMASPPSSEAVSAGRIPQADLVVPPSPVAMLLPSNAKATARTLFDNSTRTRCNSLPVAVSHNRSVPSSLNRGETFAVCEVESHDAETVPAKAADFLARRHVPQVPIPHGLYARQRKMVLPSEEKRAGTRPDRGAPRNAALPWRRQYPTVGMSDRGWRRRRVCRPGRKQPPTRVLCGRSAGFFCWRPSN